MDMNYALPGMGLLLIALALWSAWMNERAMSWPAVAGVIVHSELQTPGEGEPSVRIEYEYRVAGVLHRSANLGYAGSSPAAADKAAQVATYPLGREVTVFVDPAQPGRAVLERRPSRAWMGMVAAGLVLLLLGLFRR
jgi:hypothetical protein